MNLKEKEIALKNLKEYTNEQIVEFVLKGNLNLIEIQEQLKVDRFKEIERDYNKFIDDTYNCKFNELKDQILDPLKSFYSEINLEYLTQLLNSKAIRKEHINELLNIKSQRISRELGLKKKEVKLLEIQSIHTDNTIQKIKEFIKSGEIELEDLRTIGFSNEEIEKIEYNQEEWEDNQHLWRDIMPLRDNSTDIYMMGRPGSGKSTTLAGILYEAHRDGRYRPDTQNILGSHYGDDLVHRISVGLLPKKTGDNINYISADLRNNSNGKHRVNFIEMSGERFLEIYNGTEVNDTKDYLQNKNRKIIYFIIDFVKDVSKKDLRASQSTKLTFVLNLFKAWHILDKTDAIFIVLNKSDLLLQEDESISKNYETLKNRCVDYVKGGLYASFYNDCLEYKNEFNFHFETLPGSVGKFKLADLYNYDPKASFEILRTVINYSSFEKKKSIFGF